MLSLSDTSNSFISIKNRKSKIFSNECRICGAYAEYSHFDVISCYACKTFFKRNANSTKEKLICKLDGQCEIKRNNRHMCSSCRLAKCFKYGMTTDKFRASRSNKSKTNKLVKGQVQHQSEKLPTLSLLQSDKSLLTIDEWRLLSNLYNCYKESELLSISQCLLDTHDNLQSNYPIYEALVEEFLASVYRTTGAYICFNGDICKLSSDDRSIILRSASDNVACLGGPLFMYYCHLYSLNAFLKSMECKYGKITMDIHLWILRFIDPDIVLVKLAISLFSLSENTCLYSSTVSEGLTNPIQILQIQNKYAEITWKYLLYKYDYHEAIKRFLNLTLWLCSINILIFHAQTLTKHVNDINSLVEQTELTLLLNDVDQIIETN